MLPEIVTRSSGRPDRPFRVEDDFAYPTDIPGVPSPVRVPANYLTDIYSIPWFFRWAMDRISARQEPAVIHDRLYATRVCTRAQADDVLLEAMMRYSVPAWQRTIIWLAVRFGGKKGWEGELNALNISAEGIALIKEFEGCKLEAYLCPENVPTIGYGCTSGVALGQKISLEEAERMLRAQMAPYEKAINQGVKVPLTQGQFDALCSFAWNVGPGWISGKGHKQATFIARLNNGDYNAVEPGLMEFTRGAGSGKHYDGLKRRRRKEADLFERSMTTAAAADDPTPQDVAPPSPWKTATTRFSGSTTVRGLLLAGAGTGASAFPEPVDALTKAAAEATRLKSMVGEIGLSGTKIGTALAVAGILYALYRQFKPRSTP